LTSNRNHNAPSLTSIATWIVFVLIILFALPAVAQDKQPINNKGKVKQMKAKSVKKKGKASTKDIAGKRLRTKNANSTANRAVYSNPSPYANERRGKDKAAKPMGGQSGGRIRSRSGESARTNVYPQRGPYVNHSSKRITGQSRFTRTGPKSRSTSAESSRSNVYPQRGPFVNRSPRQPERTAPRAYTRTGRLSTSSARISKTYTRSPRSVSQSAETSKSKRFGQGGAYVNQSSRSTENFSRASSRYSRKTKLSAGPTPPGKKKRTVTPRSASQPFLSKGKKNVYWGKFSKGEKAITTDVSGNPLRRRNYRTPPNEIIKPKDPYANRKKSKGDRAYSGTFRSGHVSGSKQTERAWIGDVSGQPIRKRPSKQTEVAGKRTTSPDAPGRNARLSGGGMVGKKPVKGAGGSISASGKYRSNQPFRVSAGSISASGKYRSNQSISKGGGSISASGKYRSNKPFRGGAGSISASGKYRSNKPFTGRSATLSVSGKFRDNTYRPQGGGSISASGKYRTNQPLRMGAGSISATGKYRSNKPFRGRAAALSISGQKRVYDFKPNGGGSMSGKLWNNDNRPIEVRTPGMGGGALAAYQKKINAKGPTKIFSQGGLNYHKGSGAERARKGNLTATGKTWNNNNKALPAPNYGKTADNIARFQGNAKVREPKKGGGSVSGKLWNNNGRPIEVRTPLGERAADVEGMQVLVKAKETGTKPKAVKGSMPGLPPTKATVKASEYSRGMKAYWSYKHNPSSVDEAQKTIAPSKYFVQASDYSGRTRLTKNYRHNPMSNKDALKVIAPGRAYARITDYQGNVRMSKYHDKRFLPDSKFAHNRQNNVKQERTIMTDFKLLWAKIFKKNGTQPDAVKEKTVRPRYDKRERELWPGLYD